MSSRNFWLSREVFLGAVFLFLIAAPMIVFGSHNVIFVDKDATGSENGTFDRPYHTISKALKNAENGDEVRIKNGEYKENITIPKDVKLVGDSEKRSKVTIKADNDDKPVVIMKDDTKLSFVTIKDGRHGVRIEEDAKAHIFNVVIRNNERDGIHIESAPRDKKHRVLIDESEIKDNGKAGIFSEKRFIVLIDSDIVSNDGDGLDLAAGTKAWLEDNRFNDNKGSGAKLILDGASIFGKKNGFRDNKREGLEVNAFGTQGTIELKRSAFVKNDRHGVARVARTAAGTRLFGNLSFGIGVNGSRFEGNASDGLSSIIRGF